MQAGNNSNDYRITIRYFSEEVLVRLMAGNNTGCEARIAALISPGGSHMSRREGTFTLPDHTQMNQIEDHSIGAPCTNL